MGETAEILAKKYNISREMQDKFSLASHQKAVAAIKGEKFKEEIVPITVVQSLPDGKRLTVVQDEGPREDTSLEKLAALKPAFLKDGTVTAGNSSQMTDGAAVVVLMSARKAKELGVPALARIRGMAVAGCAPETM